MSCASSLFRCFITCAPILRDTALWASSPLWTWEKIRSPVSSLTPPPAAGAINSPLPGHLRPVIQLGPHRRWWTARSWGTSGPHLEPRQACPCEALLTWQFKKDHSGGMVFIFYKSPADKLGLSLFGRGFEKGHVLEGLWLVLITWCLVVDIWSVGCIMAEMVLHKVLFPGRDCILHRERPSTNHKGWGHGWACAWKQLCGDRHFLFLGLCLFLKL